MRTSGLRGRVRPVYESPQPCGAKAIAFLLTMAALACPADRVGAGPAATPRRGVVSVTTLPQGETEIVGAAPAAGQALRLSPRGEWLSWDDAEGNRPVEPPATDVPAVEVLDPANPNRRLFPSPKGRVEVRAFSASEVHAAATGDGVRLVYVVEQARLGLRVE